MNVQRFLLLSAFVAGMASFVACGGETVHVGSNQQALKKTDGGASGDGGKCSFDDVPVSSDGTVATHAEYSVGETFVSPDGCNTCSCTASGIVCTQLGCTNDPAPGTPGTGTGGDDVACSQEAKECPDGTYVARIGPNCEFAPCK